jgi:tRNA(Ser,Leu) C12 N-acetylase TAN1
MKNWNLVVTAVPGPRHVHDLLAGLRRFGHFAPTSFKDVIIGEVQDPIALFEAVAQARAQSEPWGTMLGRAIPIQTRFRFTPDTLLAQLCEAAEGLLDRLAGGSFYVRLERRGHVGELASPEIERAVADHLFTLAEARGVRLRTDFHDPDNILVVETLGDECGVALISRELRTRYPFVHTR